MIERTVKVVDGRPSAAHIGDVGKKTVGRVDRGRA
jgi:hypothetical protein